LRKEFTLVALGSLAAVLLLPLADVSRSFRHYLTSAGVVALGLCLLWILVGIVLAIPERTRRYGQAFLITSVLMLLASFTLCSQGTGLL